MPVRRIFIVWTHALFYESLCLLLKHPLIKIVGETSDHAASYDHIAELNPDAVIIEETDNEPSIGEETIVILQESPMVIRMSLSDNKLNLYQRHQRTVARAEELLELVLANYGEETHSQRANGNR